MSIPTQYLARLLENLSSSHIDNLITQADARRILQEVKESEENFPRFDSTLTEKATYISYALISCGCSLIENEDSDAIDGLLILEKAGKLMSDAFCFNDNKLDTRDLHILIASMAFYSSKQYSRAFIVLKDISVDFLVGQLVFDFIRKDFTSLLNNINNVMLISEFDEADSYNLSEWIITFEIARTFSIVLDFVQSGNNEAFTLVKSILNKIQIIAYEDNLVSYWLIIKLLKIIFSTFQESSLWSILPPLLPAEYIANKYIRLLSNFKPPVTELWPSQTTSLSLALGDNDGAVINLRTSAGKTRIAEISILKTLSVHILSKILYLAPFRSLAFEIEQSLSKTFTPLGITVSQLYGGATANVTDFELISESQIIIATPEKAKALIRCGSGLEDELKLIVIDEGHLLGANERHIRNEMFFTHIKEYATRNNIRILLLSAVLPNADELAQWIADDKQLVAKSDWKPSLERQGLLLWNGSRVRLEWKSGGNPFNPSFIQSKPLGYGLRRNPFPNNKNEAVAAAAVKLSSSGTVMVYSARANSINGLAKSVLLALGEHPIDYPWDKSLWAAFENICNEELEDNDIILKAAKKGVICHNNRLPTLVRITIERLMRSKSPLIIIASSTLGQGVNISISTVIVSTPYYSNEPVNNRDFWNICGRAGRAFVDTEGKILYTIDTQAQNERERWRVSNDFALANRYFDNNQMECARSGVAAALKAILSNANRTNTSLEILLEAIANDFIDSDIPSNFSEWLNRLFDYIDDELLAMHEELSVDDNIDWIDEVFRKSLALIQAESEDADKYISLLKARTSALLIRIPKKSDREKLISSGVPFSVSKVILENIDFFHSIAMSFIRDSSNEEAWTKELSTIIRKLEIWCNENASNIMDAIPEQSSLDSMRQGWISGLPLRKLREITPSADDISKEYYGFSLPWIIHAISQMFDPVADEAIIQLYSRIAMFIELGLPNDTATNIYLAGIRSRSAALELSEINIFDGKTVIVIKKLLLDEALDSFSISDETMIWLDLLSKTYHAQQPKTIAFPDFTWKKKNLPDKLYPRNKDSKCFLVSYDGYFKEAVESTDELPFEKISNIAGVYFECNENTWSLKSYNPLIKIR